VEALILFILAQTLSAIPYYVRYALWGLALTLILHLSQGYGCHDILSAPATSPTDATSPTPFLLVRDVRHVALDASARLFAFFIVAFGLALAAGLAVGAAEHAFHSMAIKGILKRTASRKLIDAHPDGPAPAG